MTRTSTRIAACLAATLSAVAHAGDVPLDLSSWTELTLDLPGGQSAGNWSLSADNTSVTQTVNADPSFFISDDIETSYTMNGTWVVETTSDDDLMGFAFGYQDPGHCYIMDWKQNAQSVGGYGFRDEGFVIRKMHGDPSEMTIADYWSHEDAQARYTILATSFGPTMGWADNTEYDFTLVFAPGEFRVTVREGASLLWDVTIADSEYGTGAFSFYNYSQGNVRYSSFTQNLIPVCDPGGPYAGAPELPIMFDGTGSFDGDGTIVEYAWDFGDGSTGSGETPVHTYDTSDTYLLQLCVTDDGGQTSCCETTAYVDPSTPIERRSWSALKGQYR